jgi:hypothetical protein
VVRAPRPHFVDWVAVAVTPVGNPDVGPRDGDPAYVNGLRALPAFRCCRVNRARLCPVFDCDFGSSLMFGDSPFDEDVLLKGTLVVRVTDRRDGRPLRGLMVMVRACGFG